MKERISKLRKFLKDNNIDAYLSYNPLNTRYLSGFTGSSGYIVVSENIVDLATDSRYAEQASLETEGFNIIEINSNEYTIFDYLREKKFNAIAIEENYVTLDMYNIIRSNLFNTKIISGSNILDEIKRIKNDEELELIRQASNIVDKTFAGLLKKVHIGITEMELAIEALINIKKLGAEDFAWTPIIVSGARSSLPHGKPTDKKLELGDFVTFDLEIRYKGYTTDFTRTIVMGKATEKQKNIYSLVLRAQQAAIDNICHGMTGFEADKIARDIIEAEGYGEYFGHSLGHGLGDRLALANDSRGKNILKENMIFTIEPGIYIKNFGGVRIEDTVVLTNNGCISLFKTPRDLIEII